MSVRRATQDCPGRPYVTVPTNNLATDNTKPFVAPFTYTHANTMLRKKFTNHYRSHFDDAARDFVPK